MFVNSADSAAALRVHDTGARSLLPWLSIALLFGTAMLLRHFTAANTDVSWLLIAGERMLDGQRLYGDILETNPPMAVLVYIPGILIGRALGISAEFIVDGLVFLAVAMALALVSGILKHSSPGGVRQWLMLFLAIAVLAIVPVQVFGQREHIAVIALLPALAVLVLRAGGERPPGWAILVAGAGLGLALSFKPYFAIALLACVGALAVQGRSWRLMVVPELFIAAGLVTLYALGTLLLFPDYFTVIGPLARDVYIPIGLPFRLMLEKPVVALWGIALVAATWLGRKAIEPPQLALTAMSIGFGIVFFLQHKGWPYHSYPMMAFALLALGCAAQSSRVRAASGRAPVAAALLLLAVLGGRSMIWFNHAFDARPIQAAVARLGPHPTILAISAQAGIGHPMTRALGGTWASRQQGLIVAGYYKFMLDNDSPDAQSIALVDGYAERERAWVVEDFRKYRPTVVLVDRLTDDWDAWMRETPALVDLMKGYRRAETVMDVDIYARRAD
jgi:hypothetical protein